jgi:hypothetical protein
MYFTAHAADYVLKTDWRYVVGLEDGAAVA